MRLDKRLNVTGKLLFFPTEGRCSLPKHWRCPLLADVGSRLRSVLMRMGEGADIVRVCLCNPASGQAQIATEFPASLLTLLSIYTAAT